MTGGQIAALIFGIILLIPGGCFVGFGISMLGGGSETYGLGPPLLVIGLVILSVVGLLGWIAFRKRKPPAPPA